MGVIQLYNDDDMRKAVRSRHYRQSIGNALAKAYRFVHWMVDVNIDGGIATISCPKISQRYGMVVHLTRDTLALEAAAKRMGGELLERFRVSREVSTFDHLKYNVNGEVMNAKAGGQ